MAATANTAAVNTDPTAAATVTAAVAHATDAPITPPMAKADRPQRRAKPRHFLTHIDQPKQGWQLAAHPDFARMDNLAEKFAVASPETLLFLNGFLAGMKQQQFRDSLEGEPSATPKDSLEVAEAVEIVWTCGNHKAAVSEGPTGETLDDTPCDPDDDWHSVRGANPNKNGLRGPLGIISGWTKSKGKLRKPRKKSA